VVGHEALRAFFAAHVVRFDTYVDRVTRVLIDGDTGISELVFDPTADDRRVHLENCNVYRFRDGLVAEVRVDLDTATMARHVPA
jgi:ketosteroid isomerase-like protein